MINCPVRCNLIASYGREASDLKKDLMEILACPVCKGDLELKAEEEDEKEVTTGSLYCAKCDYNYPIADGIPNLLPPDLQD